MVVAWRPGGMEWRLLTVVTADEVSPWHASGPVERRGRATEKRAASPERNPGHIWNR